MPERPLIVGTGNIALDHLFLVERPPLFGRYAKLLEHLAQGGGPVGNALCAAARLGYPAAIYGVVGSDEAGEAVQRDFERFGVSTQELVVLPGRTREILVQVHAETGVRQFAIFDPEGRAVLEPDAPSPVFPPNAALLHLDTGDAYSLRCAEQARRRGMLISYDAGYLRRYSETLFGMCDVVKISEYVARRLAHDDETIGDLLRRLAALGPRWVVVTAGERGCWGAAHGVEEILYLPAVPVEAVDTTGAGDAAAGVLMVGLLEDRALDELLPEAAAAGALNCLQLGARSGLPTRDEIHRFLTEQPAVPLQVGRSVGAEQDPLGGKRSG